MELMIALAACVVAMLALWAWQLRSGRADWVDLAWAVMIAAQVAYFAMVGDGSIEKRVLVVLVSLTWSFRLARHLASRLAATEIEDGRYRAIRDHFGSRQQVAFFFFFLAQSLVAWLFALPGWVVANDPSSELTGWVILGVAIWLVSLAGESLADQQLARFRSDPDHRGKVCNVGLWRYSRHPNYFFEWLHWFSYPLIALTAPHAWVAWLGPVLMLAFLFRLSGIPWTEKQALKSRGEAYREYQRTTSAFFPWPPKAARAVKGER